MKCDKCGAPVRPMPPDGDIRFDPPRAYAATLAPQAAPATCKEGLQAQAALVAEGKPTSAEINALPKHKTRLPEYLECARAVGYRRATALEKFIHDNEPQGREEEAAFRNGLLAVLEAATQKNELEAEARVAEMRERAARAITRSPSARIDRILAWNDAQAAMSDAIRALPAASSGRFMRLLEASYQAKKSLGASSHTAVKILGDALAAFPQPEEQP